MIYIAAPFFNQEQVEIVEHIKTMLTNYNVEFFSPKDECMYDPATMTTKQVFDMNIAALEKTELVIVVTNGKDVGTMWEAGYCYAREIQIIYLWLNPPTGANFNLMLGASGSVCTDYAGLLSAVRTWFETDEELKPQYGNEELTHE